MFIICSAQFKVNKQKIKSVLWWKFRGVLFEEEHMEHIGEARKIKKSQECQFSFVVVLEFYLEYPAGWYPPSFLPPHGGQS